MVDKVRKLELVIVAGPNGSGKTSVTQRFYYIKYTVLC